MIVTVKDYGCPAYKRYKAFRKGGPETAAVGRSAKEALERFKEIDNANR